MIRQGEERTVVEALFQVQPKSSVTKKLAEWGIDAPYGEILIKRELTRASGKTKSLVNGEMATASMIAELGEGLIDIHGQHEHQAIFNIRKHRELVDAFGHLAPQLEKVSQAYEALSHLLTEQTRLGGDSREIARRTDLLQFQIQEIEDSGIEKLNEEELLRRFQVMKHAEKITKLVSEAQRLLDEEGEGGATGLFSTVVGRLQDSARIDPDMEKLVESAKLTQESLNQLSFDLSQKLDGYSFSDSEYSQVSDEIDALNRLKKKYGDNVEDVLKFLERCKEELKTLLSREERLKTLDAEITQAAEQYGLASAKLSAKRVQVGESLASQVQETLKELGLPHAQMGVQVAPTEEAASPVVEKGKTMHLSPIGWDKVEFLFSANPGEPLRSLAKVASGGEASRVMLGLKTVLAESDEVPTMIFDEIDTGVGARTAGPVAMLLDKLTKTKQVLSISHLAPIAGLGEHHFKVSKDVSGGKTSIRVKILAENERIEELAKMLGGEPVSDTSRLYARELYAKMRAR
jgi:DNA repair protein RecN (Recombination protein N)